jgi:CxxC motif-containing protein (DUF1111 family)
MSEKGRSGCGADSRAGSLVRVLLITCAVLSLAPLAMVMVVRAQSTAVDPGVRGGTVDSGGFISGLTSNQAALEGTSQLTFEQLESVTGSITGNPGLGPQFNSNQCSGCHAQPAVGGATLFFNNFFLVYDEFGAINYMPFFESLNGAAMNARFPNQLTNLSIPDGMVHQVFTITGRSDAADCDLDQPNFSLASTQSPPTGASDLTSNMSFRIPIALFGDGLIEIIENISLLNNQAFQCSTYQATLGICGTVSYAPDGSVNRFGWKAQNRSLLIFSGEAFNVEMGVSNEQFPNETNETVGCAAESLIPPGQTTPNGIPDDHESFFLTAPHRFPGAPERTMLFQRMLAPPTPATGNSVTKNGQVQFNNVGCNICHTTSFTTPASAIAALGNQTANLFSDLLLHHMGPCLADGESEGIAQGDMFRTPPLWGVGQRIFFLHDGRTTDIVQAVEDHSCPANGTYPASEANAVISNFNALSGINQQDLITFLRSL